jgi:hypothetical protein
LARVSKRSERQQASEIKERSVRYRVAFHSREHGKGLADCKASFFVREQGAHRFPRPERSCGRGAHADEAATVFALAAGNSAKVVSRFIEKL